jgi:hypothetical protein
MKMTKRKKRKIPMTIALDEVGEREVEDLQWRRRRRLKRAERMIQKRRRNVVAHPRSTHLWKLASTRS